MQSEKPYTTSGIKRVINACRWSMHGLRSAFCHEAAFRQEVYLFMVLAPLGLWLGNGAVEKVLLIGSLLIVLVVELINSAIENVVDRIGADRHVLAGRAKDQGSAAVMVAVVLVLFTWSVVLLG